MDRHFLAAIESNVCIGSIDEGVRDTPHAIVDTLRLILAQKLETARLDFRELPVSLLRLYFAGQRRLRRFITRIPNATLKTLSRIIAIDEPSLRFSESDEYVTQCDCVEHYFTTLLDTTLCSFERSLETVVRALHTTTTRWYRFSLEECLANDEFWENLPRPSLLRDDAYRRHCIWLTCVWRINVSLRLEHFLKPWENEKAQEWITYRLKLYRASHLDLMSAMTKHAIYDDSTLLGGGDASILWRAYPACTRICCVEELPDFVPYATDNFKTGSELKERSTLDDMIGHLFVNKTAPNICKIRNMYDITIRYGEEYPILYDILKNVFKCMLLGHAPKTRGSLCMLAAIKVNLGFEPEEADAIISEAEWHEVTKDKSVKRQRSKKKAKDELVYVKTRFKLWMLLCRHFGLYLLKEYLFYIADTSDCFAEMLSMDYKFLQYRQVVTMGIGRCRTELSRQARTRACHLPFEWHIVEFEKKSSVTYDIKSGEIKKFHSWAIGLSRKVWKGNFVEILAKKMTNTEEAIVGIATNEERFYYIDGKEEPSTERVISLNEFHFLCWCMSKNPRRTLETRWFQVMGMSEKGVKKVRKWLYYYNSHDIADNSLKEHIAKFQARSMKDYMILKTTLVFIAHCRNEQIFHLPLCYAKRQIHALRNLLRIEEWEPTPPLLGYVYQCPGCHKYANTIVEPLDERPRCELHRAYPLHYAPATGSATTTTTPIPQTAIIKKKSTIAAAKKPKIKKNNTVATAATTTSCYLNMAFYNMHDTALYCSKYSVGYKHALAQDDTPEAQTRITMRRRDNSIVIRSNKTLLLYEDTSLMPSNTVVNDRQSKKDEWLLHIRAHEFNPSDGDNDDGDDDDDDDDVPDDLDEAGEEIEPSKEDDATPKKKKTNKKVILSRVNDAIAGLNYTCNRELQMIDFIGIIKNGKALCVECGSMTEVKNFNITNRGITCNRHRTVVTSEPSVPSELGMKNNRFELHPLDMKRKELAATTTHSNSRFLERDSCAHCDEDSARYRITAIGHRFKLIKVALCRGCFELCRGFSKQIVPARQLLAHLKEKRLPLCK